MTPNKNWILTDSNPILRTKCSELKFPLSFSKKEQELINRMKIYIDSSYEKKIDEQLDFTPGIAIAAPQVGLLKKIIYVNFDDLNNNHINYLLVNPKITSYSYTKCYLKSGEGCLSVLKHYEGYVPRYYKIEVEGYDMLTNKNIKISLEGYPSICFQHEIDHLDGILYYDHINKTNKFYIEEGWIGI